MTMTDNANIVEVEVAATEAAKRGRKEIFEKPELLKAALAEIRDGVMGEGKPVATYFLTRKLADAGLVEFVTQKGEGRGRPRKVAVVTREGAMALATA
jgi:DNA-binding PadR family transcriptional regulator